MDELELWQQIVDGRKDSLEIIYRKYYDLLFNYGLKIYYEEDLIKDCIQDLFVKLYKSDSLKPTLNVRSYLLRAMKNIIHDRLSAKQYNIVSMDDNQFEMSISDHDLEILFEKNDDDLLLSKKLMETYNNLPKNQKMVIYLRFIKGFSYKEIAEVMEINKQSSMNLASRALANIRNKLSKLYLFFF
ncbi:RNA polymerase sigma-70 factor (ECF subfamily) [Dysgonomonas hofstadii]|jgi:RNA polymerase sigma-70 factor (ECF subfamily)|uniref:RNA polymerase sigma-70 factor (ECF subfamily) n=1 Tax=Dysgonomonas hofstadii TaxID=637886 RepID=A0A840CJI0_9BACT|nr:sigma-70 family RNA polymerase sigma factor [Dysgonomonas hofstadii]MBB4034168.1 RNA polymerase sigma-70 factor (ECF subfamily) [Dysgonomonas hofstadii]